MKKRVLNLILIFFVLIIYFTLASQDNLIFDNYEIKNISFCPGGECKSHLIDFINSAKSNIYCAFYDINEPKLIDVLINKSREIDVFVLTDDSNDINIFEKVHVYGLMHHKFCIKDNSSIITGSYNPTTRGSYYNNNNFIEINSIFLYYEYLNEINRITEVDQVTNNYISNISVYFSNYNDPKKELLNLLKSAKSRIQLASFSFTDPDVADILIEKKYEGLDVRVIFEKSQQSKYSQYNRLKVHNISFTDKNKYNMHHKFFIIDDVLITGSYNPTRNAYKHNNENFLIIKNNSFVLDTYVNEFDFLLSDYNYTDLIFKLYKKNDDYILSLDNKSFLMDSNYGRFDYNNSYIIYKIDKSKLYLYDAHNHLIKKLNLKNVFIIN